MKPQYRYGFAKPTPAQDQNLLVSTSKHLYLTKDGFIRYQKKPIEPRLSGSKILLSRLVLLDVDMGVSYCEIQICDHLDVMGFLARAWSIKINNPMRGFPVRLNVPKAIADNQDIANELYSLAEWGKFQICPLPGGFSGGIHAVRIYEQMLYGFFRSNDDEFSLDWLESVSGPMSMQASGTHAYEFSKLWESVPGPCDAFMAMMDRQYVEHGAWRTGSFANLFVKVSTS
ncbi:hypothetical protein RYA05_04690 [Pseudomonas syringae pv. actinidiae]|nr:hypothetical protein [Pseudomonas syringae pv. actinidiae]